MKLGNQQSRVQPEGCPHAHDLPPYQLQGDDRSTLGYEVQVYVISGTGQAEKLQSSWIVTEANENSEHDQQQQHE